MVFFSLLSFPPFAGRIQVARLKVYAVYIFIYIDHTNVILQLILWTGHFCDFPVVFPSTREKMIERFTKNNKMFTQFIRYTAVWFSTKFIDTTRTIFVVYNQYNFVKDFYGTFFFLKTEYFNLSFGNRGFVTAFATVHRQLLPVYTYLPLETATCRVGALLLPTLWTLTYKCNGFLPRH